MEAVPNEIIFAIFENLSYFDLKLNVQLTCRRFRALITASSTTVKLDRFLYRDKALQKRSLFGGLNPFKPHPVFTRFIINDVLDPTETKVSSPKGMEYKLSDLAIAEENAVSPAVCSLWLGFENHDGVVLKNEHSRPLSVRRVADAISLVIEKLVGNEDCSQRETEKFTYRLIVGKGAETDAAALVRLWSLGVEGGGVWRTTKFRHREVLADRYAGQ